MVSVRNILDRPMFRHAHDLIQPPVEFWMLVWLKLTTEIKTHMNSNYVNQAVTPDMYVYSSVHGIHRHFTRCRVYNRPIGQI
jgi:hypothetical protein